ncbi:MAG: endonuclease III [Ignavibacteriae bacterium]|nr:endonuclease III [Ignavibacteriota bacterium]NOH00174.1 endonuclease III [Ignavibacteriota bacterium]
MFDKRKIIIAVNKLLIKKFGIPPRNSKLPNPLDMIIATILSQNTNDKNSYRAFENLKAAYKNWDEVRTARRDTIENKIKVAGLGFQKSTAIKNFLQGLYSTTGKLSLDYINDFKDEEAIQDLTSYKGIGVKTASCVLLFALDRNICPVDTHVHRTLNRIGIVETKTPDKTFTAINEKFPAKIAHQFHTNLIRLGREICVPKNPRCGICPLVKVCEFEHKIFDNKSVGNAIPFMLLDNVNG